MLLYITDYDPTTLQHIFEHISNKTEYIIHF